MKNRICLITGGTSGVGHAIAVGCARLGATVIIVSSGERRGADAVDAIKVKTGNDDVFFRVLDLGDIESIRTFAARFKKEFKALHVLSNNAAVLPMRKEFTKDGIEKIFGINYLSHFVLTYSLLDLLKSSVPSRVITVSGSPSILKFGKLDLDDLVLDRHHNPIKATLRAAFAKVAFSYALSKRLRGSGVTSNTFHPGFVKSKLTRQLPWILRIGANVVRLFSSEECETGIYLASSPEVENVTGSFFKKSRVIEFYPCVSLDEISAALWEKSKFMAGFS